ncbi:MAG: S9 family peptidase [Firmicutes bacterium]|nr:S9 family peptidase [Bacillota bacterium]
MKLTTTMYGGLLGLLSTSLMGCAVASSQAQTQGLTAEDIWAVKRPSAPVMSPQGDRAIFSVTQFDLDTDGRKSHLHMLEVGSNEITQITFDDGAEGNPQWSPNGEQIAFTARRGGSSNQLFMLRTDGGEAKRLTDLPVGVSAHQWMPDGESLVFMAQVPSDFDGDWDALAKQQREQRDSHVTAFTTENRLYRHFDQFLTQDSYPRLFKVAVESGEINELTPGWSRFFNIGGGVSYDISPDGQYIALTANTTPAPYDSLNADILLLRADGSGDYTNITEGNPGRDIGAVFSPDGQSILYGRSLRSDFYADQINLVRHDIASGDTQVLTEDFDRTPGNWQFSRDGEQILFEADDRAMRSLFAMPADGGEVIELYRSGTNSGLQQAANGDLLFVHHGLVQMPEIFSLSADSSHKQQITNLNTQLQQSIDWGRVENVTFSGADGADVQMFVVYPPGFDESKQYPLLNLLHGGPHGNFGDFFHFRWNSQVFAAPGYITIMPNFHGSSSFGQDFTVSIHGEHPTKPFIDSERAVEFMLERDYVDPDRLAAAGGSYGGYLVSWIAGHTDRYQALINHAGVYNLMGQFASDTTAHRGAAYGGTPWDGLDDMLRWSPAMHAHNFSTPMLIMHGELDYRVPVTQGLEVYGVYKGMGLDARLVYYPNENHWILNPNNSVHWFGEFQQWLDRYLGAGPR